MPLPRHHSLHRPTHVPVSANSLRDMPTSSRLPTRQVSTELASQRIFRVHIPHLPEGGLVGN